MSMRDDVSTVDPSSVSSSSDDFDPERTPVMSAREPLPRGAALNFLQEDELVKAEDLAYELPPQITVNVVVPEVEVVEPLSAGTLSQSSTPLDWAEESEESANEAAQEPVSEAAEVADVVVETEDVEVAEVTAAIEIATIDEAPAQKRDGQQRKRRPQRSNNNGKEKEGKDVKTPKEGKPAKESKDGKEGGDKDKTEKAARRSNKPEKVVDEDGFETIGRRASNAGANRGRGAIRGRGRGGAREFSHRPRNFV